MAWDIASNIGPCTHGVIDAVCWACTAAQEGTISSFSGRYSFLSNFFPASIMLEGQRYSSVEHAYQASKTQNPIERALIRECFYPAQAKRAGQRITVRSDWQDVKIGVMESLLKQKFQYHELKERLLLTRNVPLIEGNRWHDTFWGWCSCTLHYRQGHNHLGRLLEKIREELR